MTSIFSESDIISTYTRQQAIKDGVLIDMTTLYPDITKQLYKFPVAATAEVWSIVERSVSSKRHANDHQGVIWDILWMSQQGIIKRIDESQHIFIVIITGASPNKYHDFKIICHPGDSGEPVLTIMMLWED